jgi:hypothetical protein
VSSIPEKYEIVVIDNASRVRSSSQRSNTSANSDNSVKNVQKDSTSKTTTNGERGMDFLSKYDSSIAQLKSNIDEIEKNAR